jgi:hypothetical protein
MDEGGAQIGDESFVGFFGKSRCGVGFGHAQKEVAARAGLVEPGA